MAIKKAVLFGAALLASAVIAAGAFAATDSYSWGNVRFEGGGFVDGIVPSRTQKDLVYIRTDVGGAYRWNATTEHWIPLMDWITEQDRGLYGTQALALDPNDPARLYILAGTSYFSNGKTMILRSDDYGATFDTVNVTSQFTAHGNGLGRNSGEKLAVDPQNGAVIFCGTSTSGLFRSADSGKTWTLVEGTKALSGASLTNDVGIAYVLFDSTSGKASNGGTKNVYVGVGTSSVASLYKSTDGGATFAAVTGAPSYMAMRGVIRGDTLYGTYSNGSGPYSQNGGQVWKYILSTGAWTNITPRIDSSGVDLGYYASGHEGYGYAFNGITVDPTNSKRLIVATLSCYGGANVWADGSNNAGDVFFLSEDGGSTWKVLNPWNGSQTVDANGDAWISGSSIHWAASVEFDPFDTKKVWSGSGNGVFRTDDVTAATPLWKFQSKGIEETVPMQVVSVPGGPLVTAMMDYDGATYDSSVTVSVPAHKHPIGTSNSLGYAALVGGFLRSGRVTDYSVSPSVTYDVLYYSADSGRTWTATDTSSLPGSAGTLAMSADGSTFLLRPSNVHNGTNASANSFYRSNDKGKTWTQSTGLSAQNGVMVADQVNPARFYILPDGYNPDFYASSDTGKTFAKVSNLNTACTDTQYGCYAASSGKLVAAPGKEGDLWLCLDAEQSWNASGYSSNGLAHSTDGGVTWTRMHTMDGCLSIGLGKAKDGADYYTLYMWGAANGGTRGIYRSTDKGSTWERINDDAHTYGGPANGGFVTGDMNVYGRVYMSTAGRGIVYGNIGALEEGVSARPVRPSYSAALAQAGLSLIITANSEARLVFFNVNGKMLRSQMIPGSTVVPLGSMHGAVFARLIAPDGKLLAQRRLMLP